MLLAILDHIPVRALAVHFHHTYGRALANILVALQVSVYGKDEAESRRLQSQHNH